VTTHSITAYRLYARGTRAYYAGDFRTALGYFDSALADDSMFALAAYYGALAAAIATKTDAWTSRIERATQLAARAPDRERLIITADLAYRMRSPTLRQIAETLVVRYPAELEGHLYSGIALVHDGQFLAAAKVLGRVVAMDSSAIRGAGDSCSGCAALPWLVSAYGLADSQPAAERVAREWLRLQPGSRPAASTLIQVLELEGRARDADSTFRATTSPDLPYVDAIGMQEEHLIRVGDYSAADQLLEAQLKQTDIQQRVNAAWLLTISLREQGRLDEALEMSRRLRRFPDPGLTAGSPQSATVIEAQVQLERGRGAVAAALFDSIGRLPVMRAGTWLGLSRPGVWMLTHAAGARVAAGDTVQLERIADSVRTLGEASGYARDQRLYHHLRGMLLAARRRDADAASELRAAIYSISGGYTRTNYELARILLRTHQPREAIAVLQPSLRAPLDGSNLYMNRIELHELLARAWELAGVRDSAAAHYDIVARAWAAGDPSFKARADSARTHAGTLKH
jgi:predicted Zn-dependent protease